MSTASLERRLIALDKELHDILNILKTQKAKETKSNVVESSAGAWGYDVDSAEFVDRLRKSKRLDWI